MSPVPIIFRNSMSPYHEVDSMSREARGTESALARRCLEISKACNLCRDLENPAVFWHSLNMDRLIDAAKSGCCSCRLLLEGVSITCRMHGLKDVSSCSFINRERKTQYLFWKLYIRSLPKFDIYTLPGNPTVYHQLPQCDIQLGNTSSERSLELARSWLKKCRQGHQCCNHRPFPIGSIFPNRVLDLGDPTCPLDLGNIKLFESRNETSDYACLSHCWGKVTLHTTTNATIQSNRINIPWLSLPKTFQDAVKVTHKLGIRYLWIDSLCIIQDDPKDWSRESALMANIYGSSTITLAATASHDANNGLFVKFSNDFVHQQMQVPNTECIPGNVYYRPSLPHCDGWEILDEHRADYPLFARAWAYQERFLSRRILHFTKMELTWECSETSTCQCVVDREWPPRPNPYAHSTYFRGVVKSKFEANAPVRFPKERYSDMVWNPSNYNLVEKWYDILRQYCRLDLTFEKDKLPALSGVAKLMQYLRKNDIYLAGLWKDSLHRDLCWYFEDPGRRHPGERAPSWSWISVNGKKLRPLGPAYTFGKDEQKISILHIECKLAGTDTTGQVASGYLKCQGWFLRGKLEKDNMSRPRFTVSGWYSSFHPDFPLFNQGPKFEKMKEIFLVRILDAGTDMSSLVLRNVDAKSNTYERIGLLKSTNPNWQQARWLQTTLTIV